MRQSANTKKQALSYAAATRSFIGYLEGTQKSLNTIKNYRLDIAAFEKFLTKILNGTPSTRPLLDRVEPTDLERYNKYLKIQGFKTNTRRRKLLTVRMFLAYLSRRKKMPLEFDRPLPAPAKVERVPQTVELKALLEAILALPREAEMDVRNRLLLWVLAESGCLVSEVRTLRFDDFEESGYLQVRGKSARRIPVSVALAETVLKHASQFARQGGAIFLGFNRYGPVSGAITARGVEHLVKAYAPRLVSAEQREGFTPRVIRHSVILGWWKDGVKRDEIQRRLGLKTPYAFRVFEPLFKSKT